MIGFDGGKKNRLRAGGPHTAPKDLGVLSANDNALAAAA